MDAIYAALKATEAPDVPLSISGFTQTLSEVVRDLEAARLRRVNAEASSRYRLRDRHRTLCSLVAYYVAYQEACRDVDRLPARFSGQSRSNATKVVNELIEDRESRARAFLKRADSARAEGDPIEIACEERRHVLQAEERLQRDFKKAIKAHNIRGPQPNDIAEYTRVLKQHRDWMKQEVATLFSQLSRYLEGPAPEVSSPIHFVDPFTSASSPAHGHDHPSESLAKSQYRPIPRRILV